MALKDYSAYKGEHPDTERILATLAANPQGLSPFELAQIIWKSGKGDRDKALAMDNLLDGLSSDGKINVKVKKTYFPLQDRVPELPQE